MGIMNRHPPEKYTGTARQFAKYLIVGGIAFIFDFSTLFFLTDYFLVSYLTSAAVAFIVGLNVNYFLAKLFVFKDSKIKNTKKEYVYVALISFTGLLLNQFIIWTFTEIVGTHYLVSKLISTALILVYNFTLRKMYIFA